MPNILDFSVMTDFRKKFLINAASIHLGFQIDEDSWNKDVTGFDVIEQFLDTENCLILCASLDVNNEKKQIKFEAVLLQNSNGLVVFYKNQPASVTDDNLLSIIQVSSIRGPPNFALYHTLHHVFSPLLMQGQQHAGNLSIQRQLASLQAGLHSAVLTAGHESDPFHVADDSSLSVVISLDHEVEYWNAIANTTKNKDHRTSSAEFRDILQPLAKDMSVLDALPLTNVEDLLENAHNVLDDLWRHEPPFPKNRIVHIMDLIASDLVQCTSKHLINVNVWTEEFQVASELLQQCISTGNRWVTTCKQLTHIFWPNYSLHVWSGEPHEPRNLKEFLNRLEEVLNIRAVHRQMVRLLTTSEQQELNAQDMFKPYSDFNILRYGPHTEAGWQTAKKHFEYLLLPAEHRVADKLKLQLSYKFSNTRQLLYEFGRYSELICRPVLRQTLQTERQYLLSSLSDYLHQLAGQMASETPLLSTKYDTPQVISEIVITRQLEAKVIEVKNISEKLLDDLSGYRDLKHAVEDLLKDLKHQHAELFDSWTSEITAQISNKSLSLRETDPVVEYSAGKFMRVNYSPRLVTLICEVRQLSAFGYRIPNNIKQISEHAKQFMKHAKSLEQIANFHNTIGDRMFPSQKPMMLASAIKLSNLVQKKEVVSWGDVDSVERYVEHLKAAVEKLSNENNLLAFYHIQILEKINCLEDTDLIKDYQKWKDATKFMRGIMSQIQEKGFKEMRSWKLDIDKKLYIILEKQYLKSLDTLHLYLPEIQTDLMYRNSQLAFFPTEEILKEKYQQQLRRFLDIPKSFRGVSDGNIFADIVDKSTDQVSKVNAHADDLFKQLEGVAKHWESWISLGVLDITRLVTWQHWDLHFRASKTFGQEIAKLPDHEEKVGCFVVGLSRFRSDLESYNRSYWAQLVATLKDSIAQSVVKLQQYVDTSTATLHKQPLTVEQICDADVSHANILRQASEMEELYKEVLKKTQMLASWTRERVDSVNRLQGAWDRLQNSLGNHQHLITKQIETVKTTLNVTSENLRNDIERFAAKWEQVRPRPGSGQISDDSLVELQKHLETIREKRAQWKELLEQKDKLLTDYTKFGMDIPDFSTCDEIQYDLDKEESMWVLFEEFYSELEKLYNEEWIVFRKKYYRLEDFLSDWNKRLEKTENTPLATRIMKEILKYQMAVPVLKYVRGEDFTEKHWIETLTLLGIPPKPIDILYLKDLLNVSDNLVEHEKDLQAICKKAASEIVVRQALAELDQWDVQCRFILTPHVDSQQNTVMLIKDFKEILSKVGDHQSLLQSVKNSADYESFSEKAGIWETRLADLDQYLTALAQIQRKWVYLEPIFGNGTLGHERARFDRLDRDFRHFLDNITGDPRVSFLCRYPNLRSTLDNLQDQLSRCQKSLDDFLAEKRSKFPRFLFLGDDDLLEIVGQSSKEQVIQAHLKKLFAGINSIKLGAGGRNITSICSLHGEEVLLSDAVSINQPVEDWLNVLVKEMQTSLKNLLIRCIAEDHSVDPLKYPSQILCLADNVTFTKQCEHAISNMTLPPLLAKYKAQLIQYSSSEIGDDEQKSMPSFDSFKSESGGTNPLELKLKALVLDTIHHISVLEELIQANVTNINDWSWQKQLRFYANSFGDVTVKMVNARMGYSYEYLGNYQKLVRTPLVDRCFLTLTQGMHLGMGGNPYGPAGTGKTESVKALGSLLGRQVLVFNCDEGIDASAMGRILSGLVRSGAWGCFDEFNRLDEATLSAVSMHIQSIQNALRTKQDVLAILDQEVQVNKHCSIFVTLNPAGGSYGGRNKLPDNLKALFRPVVMTHPDHEQIARTLLHCDGYENANLIGQKLVEVFSMASKLLSKQQHYDWGLRALRTVLNTCGQAMKQYRKTGKPRGASEVNTELALAVKALRMDTLSKLTYTDSIKFDALVCDVFSKITFENFGYETLTHALEESCEELGLQINRRQVNKCVELYEQLKQRMGVVLVGPPSCGKTTIRTILYHALIKMGRTLKQHVFNPKAMPRTQLLGQIDYDTRQWTDGILTLCSLKVTSEPAEIMSWIVCDGDIDPEWVESLNSVLDDNRLLSLPSGWRIQFGPNINFVFETHDLSYASPATISRMGIIYLSEEDVELGDFINNFIKKRVDSVHSALQNYIDDYFMKALDWIINEGEIPVARSKLSLANTGLLHFDGVVNKSHFIVKLLNGLGGQLATKSRENFVKQVFEWVGENLQSPNTLLRCYYNQEKDKIDVYYTSPNIDIVTDTDRYLPLILTAQIQHTLDSLKTWLIPGHEQHFLLVGPRGSAKTLVLNHLINERNNIEIVTIYCSAHITPKYVIHKLTQHCMIVSSNKGKVYKPKKGHLALHLKNLQLLKCDQWGTNMFIAFLQQLICYNGLFDSSLEWVGVENVTVIGTLTATSHLPTRFASIVHLYNVDLPEKDDLNIIFTSYLSYVITKCFPGDTSWSKTKVVKLSTTMLAIYTEIKSHLSVSQHQHYDFSTHDLTKWCRNILRHKDDYENTEIELWLLILTCQEALRIFNDRLASDEDRNNVAHIINNNFEHHWGKTNMVQLTEKCYFVPAPPSANKNDIPLVKLSADEWSATVQKGIIQYEREGMNLNILVTPELLRLTGCISNVLTEQGGNALLVGRSGVGRRASVRIISALQSAKLVIPASCSQPQFNNDLKVAIQYAGLEAEHVYLLFEDHILAQENILELINTLLSSGEVANLYNSNELESLVSGLKDDAGRENYEGNLLQFFYKRVHNYLHITTCLEADNNNFHNILENCPALHQNCAVIWLTEWSTNTIESLPLRLIEKMNARNNSKNNHIEASDGFFEVHNSVNKKNFTATRFTLLIKLYTEIYAEKKSAIINKQNKLQAGVSKLTEARSVVANLKVQAVEQQEKLSDKQSKANFALDMISNTMKNANVQKQEMESLKKQTEQENEQLIKRKREIEVELAEVEPLIQQARSAVGNIKQEALSEIRSLRAPPDVIRDILEGVLRLMGTQDTSWNSMKTFLAKRGVKEDIRSFDASKITADNRQAVEKLMKNRSDSFDPKSAKRASVAAAPLASWVTANVRYSYVLDKIKPLEREQNKLKQNLKSAELQLGELSAGVLNVDEAVAKLKSQLSTYTKEAAEIEIRFNTAQDTLKSAEMLVDKLNDEYERWQSQLEELSGELKVLPANCLLASAYITYLPEESEDIRLQMLEKWKNHLCKTNSVENFSLRVFISTEREQLQWQSEGLMADQLSIQNAIIILKTKICPLLLDPTTVAIKWLQNHLKNKNVEVTSQNYAKFSTTLELAVRFGKILIIEEVEAVSPILFPLLRKEYTYQGERKLIILNGKLVDYHNDFQLILCSRNVHLKLPSDVNAVLSIVNFVTTHAGLTEQLLSGVIKQVSPELENRRRELSKQREELQEKQYTLQNKLLDELASATGDILENKNLLARLNETKASSNAITTALVESSQLQSKLHQEYDVYKCVTAFGSLLYFAALEFSRVNVLYSLSVSAYIQLFLRSLPAVEEIQNNFPYVQRLLLQSVYKYMSRGIFKSDRLMFALHLTHKVLPEQIPEGEWNYFLGQTVTGNKSEISNVPAWIPEHDIQSVQALQHALPKLFVSLQLHEQAVWQNFITKNSCETVFPAQCKITEFQKVLVLQALRPDRLHTSLTQCVLHLTGLTSLNPDILQLSHIFSESTCCEPVLLLTTSGTDPSTEIRELARSKIGDEKYIEIAMGAGQEANALSAVRKASAEGCWLTLKNLHLVTLWLPVLSQNLQIIEVHEDFRLWLVTEQHTLFSQVLARNCLKIAYESPRGIKCNLQHTFASCGSQYFESLNPTAARLFFVLACVHALLQERRTYIPQGWLKSYEFSDVDFSTAIKLAEEIWQSHNTQVQWKYFIGLCAGAIYGGRVECMQDFAVLEAYLREYFVDEVLSHRWRPLGSNSSLPMSSNFQEYLASIKQLSDRDLPSYFGLPENVDRAWEKNTTVSIIAELKNFHLTKRGISKFNREEWQKGLLPFMALWKKLNQGCDFIRMSVSTHINEESPILGFMREEFENAVILIQRVHKSFTLLNRIIRGSVMPELEDLAVANSLFRYQTPNIWLKFWVGPKNPSKYLRNIVSTAAYVSKLKDRVNVDSFYDSEINLSLIFHVETFLAAFKQEFSRKSGISMDDLALQTTWTSVKDSIIVSGLLIEGAIFDGKQLSPNPANSESISSAPNCYINWAQKRDLVDKYLNVPLYYTSERDNLLTYLQVPCENKEKDKWIQTGLAFFISH